MKNVLFYFARKVDVYLNRSMKTLEMLPHPVVPDWSIPFQLPMLNLPILVKELALVVKNLVICQICQITPKTRILIDTWP